MISELTADEAWVFFRFWGERYDMLTISIAISRAQSFGRVFSEGTMVEILHELQMKGLLLLLKNQTTGERKYVRSGAGAKFACKMHMPLADLARGEPEELDLDLEAPTVYVSVPNFS